MMTKPVKTEAELIAMAKAELKVHTDSSDGMVISVIRMVTPGNSAPAPMPPPRQNPATPNAVAMLVQIGDHLGRQYDVKG